jgi:hypothetical protein
MQVLPEAGGWTKVLKLFKSVHAADLEKWPHRIMVLVIDFDEEEGRSAKAKAAIPESL